MVVDVDYLNLCGPSDADTNVGKDAWYKTQCGVSSRLGVQHGEAMSAGIMDSERVLERDLQSKGPTSMLFSEGAT